MLKNKTLIAAAALLFTLVACKKQIDPSPVPNHFRNLALSAADSLSAINLISNVVVTTDSAYQIAVLDTGKTYYTDRAYKVTSVPDSLAHLAMIKTTNADKHNTSDLYLSFTLAQEATVYIAYDLRATALPTWLQGWQKLADTIGVDEPMVSRYLLYSKVYPAGTVSLGGASAGGSADVQNQYFVLAKAVPVVPPVLDDGFRFGVNGHSLGVDAYTFVSPEDQIALLKKMGMTYYHQDITFKTDGTISNQKGFDALYSAATAAGVSILPTIVCRNFDLSASESDSYTAGQTLGAAVAAKNAAYFKYYELGNEFDNKVIISGNGTHAEDYDVNKIKIAAAYLKGMDDGIKSVQPDAKTMIDASWLHYYFLQYLIDHGNKFDIVAWHWYSDMESTATRIRIPDISVKLAGLFNKPIWFTECGQRPDLVPDIQQAQSDFITSFVKKVKQNPQVDAVLCYELFDEPLKSIRENSYGLIKWTIPYTKYTLKTVAKTLMANNLNN